METEQMKTLVRDVLERAFNQGDLSVIDEHLAFDAVDHQETPGTDFPSHLKHVVRALRTAFPDLHFEVHRMLAEGDIVAFHSTMTGTHHGVLAVMPGQAIPPTGRAVAVQHMHFVQVSEGKGRDLWHLWDVPQMLRQLGIAASPRPEPAAS
jgi:predicted ester cyclase